MFGLIVAMLAVALVFGGFYSWARRRGLLTVGPHVDVAERDDGMYPRTVMTPASCGGRKPLPTRASAAYCAA